MAADDEEDDYLAMTFDEPATRETSLQRTARLKKEAAARGRVPSKTELAAQAEAARNKALSTELDAANNIGARMMSKMGFTGGGLGLAKDARTRPIELQVKDDRGGIGMDSEKKRKLREAADAIQGQEKRRKADESEYRERNRREKEEKRHEGQMWSAMRVLEGFETGESTERGDTERKSADRSPPIDANSTPLRSIDVLWRPVVKRRREKEHERRMRHDMEQSRSRLSVYNDPDADEDDEIALGNQVEEDLDEEDPELEAFEALSFAERLEKLVARLRHHYHYCFWCKSTYPDEAMDGCPGLTEDEHG